MHSPRHSFFIKSTALPARSAGFTLIELLVVMTVIIILASITFGISRGVTNAQARSKAQGELAVLSQALEQFKSRYGDYPWVDSNRSQSLVDALTGRRTIQRSGENVVLTGRISLDEVVEEGRPQFIDITRFTVDSVTNPTQIVDPWGRPYEYRYKESGSIASSNPWTRFGFVLYSRGPRNGTLNINNEGRITDTPEQITAKGIILTDQ